MKRWIVPIAVGGLAVAGLAAGALAVGHGSGGPTVAQAQAPAATDDHVTVQAVGKVSAAPDTLTISLGVQTTASKAVDTLHEASAKAQDLIDTLKGAGVAAEDITTANLSVYPQYDPDRNTIDGYRASNSVTAELRDLSAAGAVIDAAAGAVGDAVTMNGVTFSVRDTSALYSKAREEAVANARTQAETLAKAAGVAVGHVVSIEETAQQSPPPYVWSASDSVAAATPATTVPVPVEPGQQDVQLTVTVTFALAA